MDAEEVRKYIGKRVLLVLKNNFKYTSVIPPFDGNSFSIVDKYGHNVTIECDMISLITEVDPNGRN